MISPWLLTLAYDLDDVDDRDGNGNNNADDVNDGDHGDNEGKIITHTSNVTCIFFVTTGHILLSRNCRGISVPGNISSVSTKTRYALFTFSLAKAAVVIVEVMLSAAVIVAVAADADVVVTAVIFGATRGVTVSMSAFLACHQCYCAGSSLAWGLNLRAVVCGIF